MDLKKDIPFDLMVSCVNKINSHKIIFKANTANIINEMYYEYMSYEQLANRSKKHMEKYLMDSIKKDPTYIYIKNIKVDPKTDGVDISYDINKLNIMNIYNMHGIKNDNIDNIYGMIDLDMLKRQGKGIIPFDYFIHLLYLIDEYILRPVEKSRKDNLFDIMITLKHSMQSRHAYFILLLNTLETKIKEVIGDINISFMYDNKSTYEMPLVYINICEY